MRILRTIGTTAATVLRILFGVMLTWSGFTWLTRADPAGYLADAILPAVSDGPTFGFYAPFLTGVVASNRGLFATLVGLGELMSGLSIGLGAVHRVGAAVIAFQFLNYGLMGGPIGLLSHGVMTALVIIPVATRSSRSFGVDRYLHERWPHVRWW